MKRLFLSLALFSVLLAHVSVQALYRYDANRGKFRPTRTRILNINFLQRIYPNQVYISPQLPTKKIISATKMQKKSADFLRAVDQPSEKSIDWHYVIAPHPDDEILCCAQTIRDQIQQGKRFKIIYFTDGDAYDQADWQASKEYAQTRRAESIAATRKLGVPHEDLIFLNFPDGHLDQLGEKSLQSSFTGQTKSNQASTFPATPYTQPALQNTLIDIFAQYPPTSVYLPTPEDTHADHITAGEITTETLAALEKNPRIFGYVIHGKTDRQARKSTWKKSLIRLFSSQFHDSEHKSYLERFASWKESFK